jgi:hypothetical protein
VVVTPRARGADLLNLYPCSPRSPQASSPPKNKVQKAVPFLGRKKVTVSRPRLPRIPPRIHHDLPPRNTPKKQKIPTKTPFHHKPFFSDQILKNLPQKSARFSKSCIGDKPI